MMDEIQKLQEADQEIRANWEEKQSELAELRKRAKFHGKIKQEAKVKEKEIVEELIKEYNQCVRASQKYEN